MPCLCFLLVACDPGGRTPADDDTSVPGDDDDLDGDPPLEHIPDAWRPPEYDSGELPDGMPRVEIQIDAEAMARLDADPFLAADERGVFVDPDSVAHEVDLCYRGAYQLDNVINAYDLRNWKVKFDADDSYRGSREWNFNYEPHFAQKLAQDLFRFAGVAVPGPQHVVLQVNGAYQGMYLQYEDPDSKGWLFEQFGDDEGDLYKAAFDLPGMTQYFANLTWLGPDDADYLLHYNKKTNTGAAPDDYGVVREFITDLNDVPDDEFAAWFEDNVDVDRLRSYLVVSNFIANWDSYPQRPKNFWLYQDLRAGRMVYIPWDLDNTFSPYTDPSYNQMGTSVSVLYNLAQCDYAPPHGNEGVDRPLVRRWIALDGEEQAYLDRYRELVDELLNAAYLDARLDGLTDIVWDEISVADRQRLESYNATLRSFVHQRAAFVADELDQR